MEKESFVKLDVLKLERKVKDMYTRVALEPESEFHFETGRSVALKLGYPENDINAVPEAAVESFAGVGYFFDLAGLKKGERVLDLGSGSGTDVFIASSKVGEKGHVTGVDMTEMQYMKADLVRKSNGIGNVDFRVGHMESLPFEESSFDVVISNGVINLAPDKMEIFREIARVLRPSGRMVIADIITSQHLPHSIVCSTTLWAS